MSLPHGGHLERIIAWWKPWARTISKSVLRSERNLSDFNISAAMSFFAKEREVACNLSRKYCLIAVSKVQSKVLPGPNLTLLLIKPKVPSNVQSTLSLTFLVLIIILGGLENISTSASLVN